MAHTQWFANRLTIECVRVHTDKGNGTRNYGSHSRIYILHVTVVQREQKSQTDFCVVWCRQRQRTTAAVDCSDSQWCWNFEWHTSERTLSAQIIELSTTWDFRRRTICNIFQFKLIGFFVSIWFSWYFIFSGKRTEISSELSEWCSLAVVVIFSTFLFFCFWLLMFCGVAIVLDWSWCAHLALEPARKSHSHRTMENDYESVGWSAGRTVIV